MSKSAKFQQAAALGKNKPLTSEELEHACLLADIIESTPLGQRTTRMKEHLARVRSVVSSEP